MKLAPLASTTAIVEALRSDVALPRDFFDRLLPRMGNLLELKLVLHVYALVADQQGERKCVSERELVADATVMRSMRIDGNPRSAEDNLREAIERTVSRGALLSATVSDVEGEEPDLWLFVDTAEGRAALMDLANRGREEQAPGDSPSRSRVTVERPNVFLLYEQNIGLLTPIVAELIKEALAAYPETWIRDAISVAVQSNKRYWRYIQRVLERWAREGKDDGATSPLSQRPDGQAGSSAGRYERFVRT